MAPRYGMKGKPAPGAEGWRTPVWRKSNACRRAEKQPQRLPQQPVLHNTLCPCMIAAPIARHPAAAPAPPTVDGCLLEEALGVGVGQRLDGRHGLDVQVLQEWGDMEQQQGRLTTCRQVAHVHPAPAPPAVQRPGPGMRLGICCCSLPCPARGARPAPRNDCQRSPGTWPAWAGRRSWRPRCGAAHSSRPPQRPTCAAGWAALAGWASCWWTHRAGCCGEASGRAPM